MLPIPIPIDSDGTETRSGSGTSNIHICGMGLPSYEYPNPFELSRDVRYCKNSHIPCHYFSGGIMFL
jgi:hypothetical protein